MKRNDWLIYISFLLFIGAALIFTFYAITTEVIECTSDPIRYGVEQIRENYDAEFVSGSITISTGMQTQSWNFGDEEEFILKL